MITFTPSPEFVDLVINHPSVRPTVQLGANRLSSEDVVRKPGNVVVAYEGGVALFQRLGEGLYDGHIFTLEGSRGSEALAFGRLALARLAERSEGGTLRTAVPITLPAARFYCRKLGLKPEGRDLFNEYFTTEIAAWAV